MKIESPRGLNPILPTLFPTPVQRSLVEEHARQVARLRPLLAKSRHLEIELQHLVFDLYGLTPEEVQLLRATAPLRDPLALVEAMGGPATSERQ